MAGQSRSNRRTPSKELTAKKRAPSQGGAGTSVKDKPINQGVQRGGCFQFSSWFCGGVLETRDVASVLKVFTVKWGGSDEIPH